MILYHISENTDLLIKEFVPRIPEYRASGEDNSIKRVCVSDSIEGCMMEYTCTMDIVRDIYCREEGLSRRIRVYTFDSNDINEDNFMKTEKLLERKLVPDALTSKESWIIQKIKPKSCFDIFDIEYEIDESYIRPLSLRNIIVAREFESDFDVADYSWESMPFIKNIKYKKEVIF